MNRVAPGSCIHVPIEVDSRENSYASDDDSTVTYQTEVSGGYDIEVNQGTVDRPFCISDIYKPFEPARMHFYGENERIPTIQVPFAVERAQDYSISSSVQSPRPAANQPEHWNNMSSETLWLQTQGLNLNSPAQSPPRPASQLEFVNNMPNGAGGFPSFYISLPMPSQPAAANQAGLENGTPNEGLGVQTEEVDIILPIKGSGLRRSSRKRNEAIYNEDLLANRLPRLTRWKGESSKKKTPTHSLRMRASNHYPAIPTYSDDED